MNIKQLKKDLREVTEKCVYKVMINNNEFHNSQLKFLDNKTSLEVHRWNFKCLPAERQPNGCCDELQFDIYNEDNRIIKEIAVPTIRKTEGIKVTIKFILNRMKSDADANE